MSSGLVDTTEMYLRTVYELEEEGVVPLRARLVERLRQSGPTVSETCARLEREGLLRLRPDRSLELTAAGRGLAESVMRKHRLAERLLVDVIGLPAEQVHEEACRWEHVISDAVAERLVALLGDPAESPFGQPVPGSAHPAAADGLVPLPQAVAGGRADVLVRRIGEAVQADPVALAALARAGVVPGRHLSVLSAPVTAGPAGVLVGDDGEVLPASVAAHVRVSLVAASPRTAPAA